MKRLAALAVFSTACALAQSSGTTVTTVNITTATTIPNGGVIGGPCTNYSVQYQTIDTAHIIKCTNANTRVTNVGAWTDITAAAGGGLASPGSATIPYVLSGNTTRAATGADIGGVFSGSGTYLKKDGTSGTPTGGASLPTTTLLFKGDNAGGAVAATAGTDYLTSGTLPVASASIGAVKSVACSAGTHATGAFGGDGTPTCSADTGGAATIPNGTVSSANASTGAGAGSLYYATDASGGSPFYYRPSTGASPLQLLTLGASGALAITSGNVLDINTSVVPQVGNAQTWAGAQTFASLKLGPDALGATCASGVKGALRYIDNATSGQDHVQACVYNGTAYAWVNIY